MTGKNKSKRTKSKPKSQRLSVSPFVGPFPPRMIRDLRYVEWISMTESAAQVGAYYVFTPSSLYDPNNTGTGGQPMYFDQLCTSSGPYLRYRALRTRAKLHFINQSASEPVWAAAYWAPQLTTPSSFLQVMEKPTTKIFTLGSGGSTSGYGYSKVVNFDIPHHTALGITKRHLMDDETYAGAYNSSPSGNWALVVAVFATGASPATVSVAVDFTITAEFYSLGNQGIS